MLKAVSSNRVVVVSVLAVIVMFVSLNKDGAATGPPVPSVIVANPPANPVPVVATGSTAISGSVTVARDAENPARQPFTSGGAFSINPGTLTFTHNITVPAGKRLVIEHVAATDQLPVGQKSFMFVRCTSGGELGVCYLVLTFQGTFSAGDISMTSQPVRLYADPGTVVTFECSRNSDIGIGGAEFHIFGHLVDVP